MRTEIRSQTSEVSNASLVPKLCLGTHLSPKLSFALLLFLISALCPLTSVTAAPQTVYVNPNGTIVNTTDFKFNAGKLQVCDSAGNNCVAVTAVSTPADASTTVKGITKLSVAPVSPTVPIAVGDNDSRMTNARTPTAHASTHASAGSDPLTLSLSQITGLVSALDNKQPLDSTLTAIANIDPSPDTLIYYDGSGNAGLTSLTSAGRALVDDADAAAQRATLGLVIGTNVQAYDSGLGLVKPAVAVVATSNLTLSGEQTIDGITTSGSLVLCTAQSTGSQNGPWISAAGAWTRPTWYATGSTTQAPQFLTTFVRLGTTYTGSTWRMTTAAVTIGTTATTWVQTPVSLASGNVTGTLSGSSVSGGTFGAVNGNALTALTAANITASTTVGRNILNLTNPGAITVPLINADNTVTATSTTGTGNIVRDTSPTLVTPVIGAATGTSLKLGTNPATTGPLGLPNNTNIYFRNAANNGDVNALNVSPSNAVVVGGLWSVNTATGYFGAAGRYGIVWTSGAPDSGIVGSAAGVTESFNGATVGTLTAHLASRLVTAKTANYTVLTADRSTLFTNTGASGAINFSLPAAVVGNTYTFSVEAAQTLTCTANGTDTIRLAATVSGAGGTIAGATIGTVWTIVCTQTGKWVVISHEGTPTVT